MADEIKSLLQKAADAKAYGGIVDTKIKATISSVPSDYKETVAKLAGSTDVAAARKLDMANDRLGESSQAAKPTPQEIEKVTMRSADAQSASDVATTAPKGVDPDTPFAVLTSLNGWQDNPLSSLHLPTYKIRFFTTDDDPFLLTDFSDYESLYRYITTTKKQTTIAESGVTGLNIQGLTSTNIVGPNELTRSMQATRFTMTIQEPIGTNMLDMMARTGGELHVRNYAKAPYFLEIRYQGYTEDGQFQLNPCPDYPNGGVWLYHVMMTNIDTEVNSTGSIYKIDMIPIEQQLHHENNIMIPDTVMPTGGTVGEMLKDLEDKLNASVRQMYGYQLKEYSFQAQPFVFEGKTYDPNTFKCISHTPSKSDKSANSMSQIDGKIKGSFSRGTMVHDAIELIFISSEEAQQLAKAVPVVGKLERDSKEIKDSIVFRCELVADLLAYDYPSETYRMRFNVIANAYRTQVPIVTRDQADIARDPKAQANNLKRLRDEGYLCKRYDYIYTGMNTEVQAFDTKYNVQWQAIIPRMGGENNSMQAQASYDVYADLRRQFSVQQGSLQAQNREIKEIQDKIDAKQKTITPEMDANARKATMDEIATLSADANERQRQANRTQQATSELADKLQTEGAKGRIPVSATRQTVKYAEEITKDEATNDRAFPMPISIVESNSDPRFFANAALPDSFHKDRAVFGAIMDQLYEAAAGNMINVTMDIKGDPYWMGAGNLEMSWRRITRIKANVPHKLSGSTESKFVPELSGGDALLMVTFKYPQGVADDGSPILKDHEFFTGIYRVTQVEHTWSGGEFKQTLTCIRMPLVTILQAAGYKTDTQIKGEAEAAKKAADDAKAAQIKQDAAVLGRPRGGA